MPSNLPKRRLNRAVLLDDSQLINSAISSSAEAGVVVQLLGLQPQQQDGVNIASKIAGAYTSSGQASNLIFTLPYTVNSLSL